MSPGGKRGPMIQRVLDDGRRSRCDDGVKILCRRDVPVRHSWQGVEILGDGEGHGRMATYLSIRHPRMNTMPLHLMSYWMTEFRIGRYSLLAPAPPEQTLCR